MAAYVYDFGRKNRHAYIQLKFHLTESCAAFFRFRPWIIRPNSMNPSSEFRNTEYRNRDICNVSQILTLLTRQVSMVDTGILSQ